MKNPIQQFSNSLKRLAFFGMVVFSCMFTLTFNSSCEEEDICTAVEIADLVLSILDPFIELDNNGQLAYDIISVVVNVADGSCSESSSDNFVQHEEIFYSETGDNYEFVSEKDFQINSLGKGDSVKVSSNYKFLANGYYKVVLQKNPVGTEPGSGPENFQEETFVVTSVVDPTFDANGELIVIIKGDETIEYFR